jgi:hypothetical protein
MRGIRIIHVLVEPDAQLAHLALAEVGHADVPTIPDTGHLECPGVSMRRALLLSLRYRLFDLLLNPSSLIDSIIPREIYWLVSGRIKMVVVTLHHNRLN